MEMKDELADVLEKRVGLQHDKAEQAAQTVLDYLKQRAPEPVKQYLEGGFSKGIGGIFGG